MFNNVLRNAGNNRADYAGYEPDSVVFAMLTSFHLINFKSFKQKAVLPLNSLTVLMGANAAGKSNALEGLRLLSWLAQGHRLSTIQYTVNQSDQVVRGRVSDLFQKGETSFTLGCTLDSTPDALVEIMLALEADELHIQNGHWDANIQDHFPSILFLDPNPARMRDYGFLADRQLGGDGANLSSVLFRLCEAGCDREILSFIQSLPEQNIQGLSFLQGPRGDVMVQLVESFGGVQRAYEAALLSDGTLRVLAIAAAMLSAPEESMVVLEEIDNGVHPSRAQHLLERIQSIAERRKLRVLISTHNPVMLDVLPDKAVSDVVFCYRDPVEGHSRLVRLGDLPDAPELLLQNTLGHLVTTGMVDHFVKNHPSPAERKQKAQAWLATLRASASQSPEVGDVP